MSQSREIVQDDQELVRYLLGLLPDDEAERLDEASIVDDDIAARLRSVENDLVDAYVSGTLTGTTLGRFETFYLSSPRRREKVALARRFLRTVDRAHVPTPVPVVAVSVPAVSAKVRPFVPADERREARTVSVFRSPFVWRLATAAAVLLVVACGALLFENARLRRGLNDVRQEAAAIQGRTRTLAHQVEEERAENAETLKALEGAHEALATRGANGRAAAAVAPPPVLAPLALVLSPQTRSLGPTSTVLVAPSLDRVAFDLRLEANDFPRYRVELKDPGTRQVVWRSGAVLARSSRGAGAVSIAIPANILAPQHYLLELAGLDPSGRLEPIASYTFQIERP